MVFFRLHESPRYLVHAGRAQEALESLQMISRFNGSNLAFVLDDMSDNHLPPRNTAGEPFPSNSPVDERQNLIREAPHLGNETNFDVSAPNAPDEFSVATHGTADFSENEHGGAKNYHSTGESPNSLDNQGHTFATLVMENPQTGPNARPTVYTGATPNVAGFKDVPPETTPLSPYPPAAVRPRPRPRLGNGVRHGLRSSGTPKRGTMYEVKRNVG